ncbi:MAG: DUF5723 family protein [Candidatus Kryptoniota bacterium]
MKRLIFVLTFILLPVLHVSAQQVVSGRLLSMGGLSTAASRDVDAIGTNPANLVGLSKGSFVLELAPLYVSAGTDFLSMDLYNSYFTGVKDSTGNTVGKYLTPADKQALLDAFPNGVGDVRFDTDVRLLAFSIRGTNYGLGFAVDEFLGAKLNIPNTILFPLNGNPPGSTLSWDKMGAAMWWYRAYSLEYAHRLPKLIFIPSRIADDFVVGLGIKYVQGYSYAALERSTTSFYTSPNDYSYTLNLGFDAVRSGLISNVISKNAKSAVGDTVVNFNPLAPAGSGLGFDIGFSAKVLGFIDAGISFTDLGSVTWTQNVVATTGDTSFTYSGFSPASKDVINAKSNVDSLTDAFNNFFKNRDQIASSFSTSLPGKLNVSLAIRLDEILPLIPGRMMVGIDYHQGLNNSFNNSTNPQIVLGAEWRPVYIFPLRSGVSFGGPYGFRWSLGTGINMPFWDIDIGIVTFNALAATNQAKSVSVVLSALKFRF